MNAQIISEHLGGRKQGNGYICHCPAHDDKNPSLQVSDTEDGKIRVFCHAKCSTEDVVNQLKPKDLWPVVRNQFSSQIVAIYPYTDENEKTLFEVVRYNPKRFVQRRPDPNNSGSFIYNLKDVPVVPFRLPNVLKAIANKETIFICEGEKDVLNLEKIGLTATCNNGGSGKWKEEHSKYFKSANVVIIPDNDDSGIKHVEVTAKTLVAHASSVKVLNLPNIPHKGDVSDWLELNKK